MVHPTSVTNIISRLERQAMVVRLPEPRRRPWPPGRDHTERGRAVVELRHQGSMAAEFVLGGYGPGQLKEIFDLLRRLRLTATATLQVTRPTPRPTRGPRAL